MSEELKWLQVANLSVPLEPLQSINMTRSSDGWFLGGSDFEGSIVTGEIVNVTSFNTTISFVQALVKVPSVFISIPHTAYWCLVTMTTVGYGDVYPKTTLGKIIGLVTMFAGIILLAIPISVFGANFNVELENARLRKLKEKRRKKHKAFEKKRKTTSFKGNVYDNSSTVSGRNAERLERVSKEIEVVVERIRKRLWIKILQTQRKYRNKLMEDLSNAYETKWVEVPDDTGSQRSVSPSISPIPAPEKGSTSVEIPAVSSESKAPDRLTITKLPPILQRQEKSGTRRFRNALLDAANDESIMRLESIDSNTG